MKTIVGGQTALQKNLDMMDNTHNNTGKIKAKIHVNTLTPNFNYENTKGSLISVVNCVSL